MSKYLKWIPLGVVVLGVTILLLLDPVTDGWLWLWNMDATERERIRSIAQIFAAAGTGISVVLAIVTFLKNRKDAPKDSKDLLSHYYKALHASCERIDLALVDEKFTKYAHSKHSHVTLPVVYQEMDVSPCRPEHEEAEDEQKELRMKGEIRQALLSASADDKYQRVMVLGDGGSGKSMFMDNCAWLVAGSHSGQVKAALPKSFRYLPIIRVRLRSAAWLAKQQSLAADELLIRAMLENVSDLVGVDAGKATWEALKPSLFERGIILLDGVDEVPESEGLRATMLEAIDWLVKDLGEQARLIITSRPYVFEREETAYWLDSFPCLELQSMQDHQVEQFINNWYLLLRDTRDYTEEGAQKEAQRLFADLQDRSDFLDFARSPLILTLLTSLHFASGILPHSRAELFDKAIALMLEVWTQRSYRENPDYPLEDYERMALKESENIRKLALQKLALAAHDKKTLKIEEDRIKGLFSDHLSPDCNANNLLDFIRYRSGLLRPSEGKYFEFYHRFFQAHLAATAIMDMDDWQAEMDKRLRGEDRWWREVFLLLVSGKIGKDKSGVFTFLFDYYVPETIDYERYSEQDWHLLFLAASAMIEQKKPLAGFQSNLYAKLIGLLQYHCQQLVDGYYHISLPIRAEAGRLLGELGDPRPHVGVLSDNKHLPDIGWVVIPAGTFRMGTAGDEGYDDEKPTHDVTVPAFHISQYPITNAQFACFVEAGGYKDEQYWHSCEAAYRWWQGEVVDSSLLDDDPEQKKAYEDWLKTEKTRSEPWFWQQRKWNNPNHPVVGVSWYEALAFCDWLNKAGNCTGTVRLPTEAEWEYAARGEDAWRYAWGNEPDASLGNYDDTKLRQTSVVGLFPRSKAFDVYDMSGNVWEWTSSQWGKSFNIPDHIYERWEEQEATRDDLEVMALRVTRGGSWLINTGHVRCAVRFRLPPGDRGSYLGFRVVLSL